MPEHIFHIRTLAWHIVFTLCLPALLFAQPSAIYTESEAEAYNDLLRDLEGIRLELNRASAKDLLILPGITSELARQIISHRPYRTLAELASVQGLSEEHIDLIAPYLSIAPPRPWHLQYTSRVSRPSKRANSFDDMRLYQRLEIASPARLSAFFLTERDPEEPVITD
ncbi:MAG: helix-hairpin-helix domain-containing protein [Gemmatimonadota bacterium]|nr:helix-hairpin-helix domain-containing protein [Gemmatimonadota bacterium]